MVLAMWLAGCAGFEVLGLLFADVQVADRRWAVGGGLRAAIRGSRANRFFDALARISRRAARDGSTDGCS
jgi:hypothetical protein